MSRELNPYWKDGGSGMPNEKKMTIEHSTKAGEHITKAESTKSMLYKMIVSK